MPSIRRSLIGYFLLLLAVAFIAVGSLIDSYAGGAIRDREAATASRIEREYEIRCQESDARFNEELSLQAASLGRDLRFKYDQISRRDRGAEEAQFRKFWTGLPAAVGVLGYAWPEAISAGQPGPSSGPGGFFGPGPRLLAQRGATFTNWIVLRANTEDLLRRYFFESDDHPQIAPYQFAFHFPRTQKVIRGPRAVADLPPVDVETLNHDATFPNRFQDVTTADSLAWRQVILRSPVPRSGLFRNEPPVLGNQAIVGAHYPLYPTDPLPYIYVQCARPKADLDARIAEHREKRDDDLDRLHDETRIAITGLRTKLGLIGLITFIALAVGGWVLVARGLAPLVNLSDAVSRVSEKDFRLVVEGDRLSYELVPIHDRLNQTLDALRRAFEREKQAVADISHELRTPVAAMLTTLEVSLRKPRSAEQYRTTIEECRDVSKQMSRLVERIMALASLDAGNDRMAREPIDAAEVAAGCATVIRPLAAGHDITFVADLDPAIELDTDPDMLREVLMNLLHNAVEYNRPGGTIHLAVHRTGKVAEFEVRDSGIGMTPDVAGRIFERFYRADSSRQATGVHAGLGLAIVKEYIDRLGGTITVESEPDVGTTFRVRLPAAAEVPADPVLV